MTDHDPYRIPPTTGPATRIEKRRARLRVKFEDVAPAVGFVLLLAFFGAMLTAAIYVIVRDIRRPEPTWLIDCPGREPWESYRGREHENGTVHAYDVEGRPVKLSADCMVTTIWPESE